MRIVVLLVAAIEQMVVISTMLLLLLPPSRYKYRIEDDSNDCPSGGNLFQNLEHTSLCVCVLQSSLHVYVSLSLSLVLAPFFIPLQSLCACTVLGMYLKLYFCSSPCVCVCVRAFSFLLCCHHHLWLFPSALFSPFFLSLSIINSVLWAPFVSCKTDSLPFE